jgi:hypothetical protein
MKFLSQQDWETLQPRKTAKLNTTILPDGRWLLFDSVMHTAITLNAPAGILWELCDGQTKMPAILKELQELYPDTSPELLRSETEKMLNTLIEQELVTCDPIR